MNSRKYKLVSLTCLCLLMAAPLFAHSFRTFYQIDIALDKEVFLEGELLSGEVKIRSRSSRSAPAVFKVEVFHDDYLEHKATVSIQKIFAGQNKYDLEIFALNQIKYYPGRWRVTIYQINSSQAPGAEATFYVDHLDFGSEF